MQQEHLANGHKMKLTLHKHIALSTILVLLSSSAFVNLAHSSELLRVFMNHARILKFENPVSSVIVGNSEIADITVSDPQTVVLTGKAYGSTNLVILNDQGEAIIDKRIVVSVDEENSVRIFRQIDRTVLSCAPICEQQAN